jgi:hypothetical protein
MMMVWWQWVIGGAEVVAAYWATSSFIAWCKRPAKTTYTLAVAPHGLPAGQQEKPVTFHLDVQPGVYREVKIPDGRVIKLDRAITMDAVGTLILTMENPSDPRWGS